MNDPAAKEERLTLELLDAIERRSDLSQRHLARQMGVALGLANSYLKRCAKKGLVKIREAPANRYLYYLTPKGFAEKARLTARFLSTSLTFYRQAAESVSELYQLCERQRWRSVLLYGVSDLAEIAVMRLSEKDLVCRGIYDPVAGQEKFAGQTVWHDWDSVPAVEAYILTDLSDPVLSYHELLKKVRDPERILIPAVLGIDSALRDAGYLKTG